ncbi:MAG: winged helix-turn-helix transcriptional regulator [Candidatus Thorarchaeota archaeon]|jgi:DNA-binding Lrp family transcriptional regulator
MDPFDKRILLELEDNCRETYENISRKLGIPAKQVKRRVDTLVSSGVISSFEVLLSLAMINAEGSYARIYTDGSEDNEEFIFHMGEHPMVNDVGEIPSNDGTVYQLFAEYSGGVGLNELASFLWGLESVVDVEIHPLIGCRMGKKAKITDLQLKILRVLQEDPRMSAAEVARRTGLTERRARNTIRQLQKSGTVMFTIWWILEAGDVIEFNLRIEHDGASGTPCELLDWLQKEFPDEYLRICISVMHRVVFAKFIVDHLRDVQRISNLVRNAPHVKSAIAELFYPRRRFSSLRKIHLEEMTKAAHENQEVSAICNQGNI